MGSRANIPPTWFFFLLLPLVFALRMAFGLWYCPVQPMEDEVQTMLIGLKFFTTGAWPYYGNDLLVPHSSAWLTQDPGPLEAFLVGLPLKLWPSPIAPYLLINLLSMGGFCLLAAYICKRLPSLPPAFVFLWTLTAPWCLHYSTSMMNFSYTIALACLFFVAFLESLPSLGLGWISRPWANAWMGFALSGWVQLHRTWVLTVPLILLTFILQWRESRKLDAPFFFSLGALPLFALIVPTFLSPDFHFLGEVSGLSFGFNMENLKKFFTILVQFFAMPCFEIPRFIGISTVGRLHFLADHWLLVPGVFLWYFGFLQVLLLAGFLFYSRWARPDGNSIRWLTAALFLFTSFSLLWTTKSPEINTFCELLPTVMIYSFYVWDYWWNRRGARFVLWFALACSLVLQPALVLTQFPEKSSFYLKYHDAIARAIAQRNFHLLGERRAGCFY